VAKGKKPKFKVTESPKSMLTEDVETNINKMTVAELKEFAKDKEIEIPADITKKDDIINFLSDQE